MGFLNMMENMTKKYEKNLEAQKEAAERHGGLNDEQRAFYEEKKQKINNSLDAFERYRDSKK